MYKLHLKEKNLHVGMTIRDFDTMAHKRWRSLPKDMKDIYLSQARMKNEQTRLRKEANEVKKMLELEADLPPLVPC